MVTQYNTSERLRQVKISRRCYTLLNQARIAPENLVHFYRTYRLPKDPFFPLFFSIKRDYLAERERIREERHQYILQQMKSLGPETRARIKYLGNLERYYNAAGRSPVWQTELFPGSKRRADQYTRYSGAEWHQLFRSHLAALSERYPAITPVIADRVLACFVLGIVPLLIPPARPTRSEVARTYRKLSLLHHPDRGGDPLLFIEIKKARDELVGTG